MDLSEFRRRLGAEPASQDAEMRAARRAGPEFEAAAAAADRFEAQLREALDAGLDEMWQVLMEDPQLGVLSPVFHMTAQIETGLFPPDGSPQKLTF